MKATRTRLERVLNAAKAAAIGYHQLTGKPLGITGELGEFIAAKQLRLTLCDARSPGYDATDRTGRRIQIKTRRIPHDQKLMGQRMGAVKLDHEWDVLLLILLDEHFELRGMYEAPRQTVKTLLHKTPSKARARGALSVTEFIRVATRRWSKANSSMNGGGQ